jgi:LmbE family N-acetylglucosaminyl deacetylase
VLGLARTFFLRAPDWGVGEETDALALRLRPVLQETAPNLIYLPHPNDDHPDHRATLPLLRKAFKGLRLKAPELRGYEVWSPMAEYDHVENITAVMRRKQKALRAHASQLAEFDYLRAITGLNQYRGVTTAKCPYAEVFMRPLLRKR